MRFLCVPKIGAFEDRLCFYGAALAERDVPDDEEPVEVDLKGVGLERRRDFGEVWLAWGLGRLLGLEVLWPVVAAILTIARNEVGNRPGRIEPRVIKRRTQRYPLMTQPRIQYKKAKTKARPSVRK